MRRISFNKNQKIIMSLAASIITISLIVWLAFGGEIFTKTEVLVDVKDELFDTTYKEWKDKFIWGLDLSLIISGAITLFSLIFIYLFRTKTQRA